MTNIGSRVTPGSRLDGVSARIAADLGIPTPSHDDIIRMLNEAEKTYHYGGA